MTLVLALALATQAYSIPQGLLSAVCYVESAHNPKAMHYHDGKGNSVGHCQIKLATAQVLGFRGTEAQLRDPHINTMYAGAYLAKQIARYHGDIRKALSAYNGGTYKETSDGKTFNRQYVRKVFAAWAENK